MFNLTSKELSKKCFLSLSAISRFCKKYQFKNYKEMLIVINQKILNYNSSDYSFESNLCSIHNHAVKQILDSNLQLLIMKAVKQIIQAQKIMILGLGTSNKIVNELSSKFNENWFKHF